MINPETNGNTGQDIAIIGMAGRFPGASSLDQFWENLRAGTVSTAPLTEDELREAGVSDEDLENPHYVRMISRIENAEDFDAEYFNCSPVEANFIDPQQRIFLECAVEALENAGCDPSRYPGHVGVFAGAALNIRHLSRALTHFDETLGEPQLFVILANDKDYVATRVSYKLGLTGPSVNVQAACSTSLVALHMACQSLLSGECDVALAGGVSIVFSYAKLGYRYTEGSVFSADGVCRPFDAAASGTVFGDGAGVVVLKRLADALADGDNIRAVIKGTAINNDGAQKASFAAPSTAGQARVVAEAIAVSGIPPETIDYFEAHGTGTSIGDPIEIEGLKRVFRTAGKDARCVIGSIKGNIGHLNAAAGVAGLIKSVLAIEHGEIPPTANFNHLNPKIDIGNTPFSINSRLEPWAQTDHPRRAGISSFGIGGTNAHVIIEGAPPSAMRLPPAARRAILLSARTPAALEVMAGDLASYLADRPETDLAGLARTLSDGRVRHGHGLAVTGSSIEEVVMALKARPAAAVLGKRLDATPGVAFVFPGQGSQCMRMGLGIYRQEPAYRSAFDACVAILRDRHDVDLGPLLRTEAEADPMFAAALDHTDLAQPAVFVTAYAMARLWMTWGIQPEAMIGHSLGELVAACIAGVFSLDDALRIVAARGRLMNAAPGGAMVAVLAPAPDIAADLDPALGIASFNGPNACVVAGPHAAVSDFMQRMDARGVPCTLLRTSHAFHTPAMQSAIAPFVKILGETALSAPQIPFISNVTGEWITADQATSPAYWADHILQPVQFEKGIANLASKAGILLLEVGPGRQMTGLLGQLARDGAMPAIPSMPRPGRADEEHDDILRAAAGLAIAGIALDWNGINRTDAAAKIVLPSYPFQRRTYRLATAQGSQQQPTPPSLPVGPDDAGAVKLYEIDWVRMAVADTSQPAARCWLVFDNGSAFCASMRAELLGLGLQVIPVIRGTDFAFDGKGGYTVQPGNAAHMAALVAALAAAGPLPDAVAYGWALDCGDQSGKGAQNSFLDVAHVVSALIGFDLDRPLHLALLSAGAQDVFGAGTKSPHGAALLGLARSLPQELDALTACYLDLAPADLSGVAASRSAQAVLPLLCPSKSQIVAWRHGRAWTSRLQRISATPKQQTPGEKTANSVLDVDSAWMITGGLGGIGLALALALAQRGVRKLALLSRRRLPPRASWAARINNADADADQIRAILALEAIGAIVLVFQADVANLAEMRSACASTRAVFGRIDNVIHCAGVIDGGQLLTKNDEAAQKVFGPKLDGLNNIETIFADEKLNRLILCSSVATLLNHPGQTDYAAANAVFDSFAACTSPCADRIIAINWDSWSEVGMAAHFVIPEAFRDAGEAWLASGLATKDAVCAFFDILERTETRVVVSKMALDGQGCLIPPVAPQTARAEGGASHPRPDIGTAYVAPRTEIEATAARIMAEMLSIEMVGIDDNFLDLGCHSLTATRFAAKMRQETGVTIPLSTLFEGLTLRSTIDALNLEEWLEVEI
jgi:acyl transferase domain-containing protein/acyl carrier protein